MQISAYFKIPTNLNLKCLTILMDKLQITYKIFAGCIQVDKF